MNWKDDPIQQPLYANRFGQDHLIREKIWHTICHSYLNRFVPNNATVLEIGAGYCELIHEIKARHKICVDINPDVIQYAGPDCEVHITDSTDLSAIASDSVDVVIANNFFEHISRDNIVKTLKESNRVLQKGGKILIIQPNMRYCFREFWMFFDHITPLDHDSTKEVLSICGFKTTYCIPRFLPYTTKSRLPKASVLIRLYLAVPLVWRVFGKQFMIIAEKVSYVYEVSE